MVRARPEHSCEDASCDHWKLKVVTCRTVLLHPTGKEKCKEDIPCELDASQSGATPSMREACEPFASAFAVAGYGVDKDK